MRMSSASRCGRRSAIVASTTAAGTINQTARGFCSCFTKSAREDATTALFRTTSSPAFSWTIFSIALGDLSKTTHWWSLRSSRRTMYSPILPRPIMPICISTPLWSDDVCGALARFREDCALGRDHRQQFVPRLHERLRALLLKLGGQRIDVDAHAGEFREDPFGIASVGRQDGVQLAMVCERFQGVLRH